MMSDWIKKTDTWFVPKLWNTWYLLVNHRLGFLIVDKETIQQRDEDLTHVGHHHHLRLGQITLDVEEMEGLVVCDEADADGRSLFLLFPRRRDKGVWGSSINLQERGFCQKFSKNTSIKRVEDVFKVLDSSELLFIRCTQYWATVVGDAGCYKNKLRKKFSKFQVKKLNRYMKTFARISLFSIHSVFS